MIVAALIALFSGLATFGVQQILANNKKKAVIAECREIGSSLLFAHQDIGFYPKIGIMTFSRDFIDVNYGWEASHIMNLSITENAGRNTYNTWSGPYFAASQSRNQISTRFKHIVTMRVTNEQSGTVYDIPWPADQWGNPYVLYLFKFDPVLNSWEFITNLGEEPDYWAAVVSYGPDGVPGSPTTGETADLLRASRCLYHHDDFRTPLFRALLSSEYNEQRREMYSRPEPRIGIVDPGSDDIIYEIN